MHVGDCDSDDDNDDSDDGDNDDYVGFCTNLNLKTRHGQAGIINKTEGIQQIQTYTD